MEVKCTIKTVQVRRILKVKEWLKKKNDAERIENNSIITSVLIRNLKLPENIRKAATELQDEIDKFIENKKNKK